MFLQVSSVLLYSIHPTKKNVFLIEPGVVIHIFNPRDRGKQISVSLEASLGVQASQGYIVIPCIFLSS